MKITVFGGASPKPGEAAYQEAYRLGALLGKNGCTVLTGGYMGTMEAVSRGASEAGALVIGVTCEEIERYRPRGPNPWIREEWRCATLHERLQCLVESCDAAIALPGGVGTLTEISLYWNRMIIGALPSRPIVLIGPGWEKVIQVIYANQGDYICQLDRRWIRFAPTPETATAWIMDYQTAAGQV